MITIAVTLVIALFISLFLSLTQKWIIPRLVRSHATWRRALLSSIGTPLQWIVWICALSFSTEQVLALLKWNEYHVFFQAFREFSIAFFTLLFLFKFIKHIELFFSDTNRAKSKFYDKTSLRAICQISRIAALFTTLIVYLQTQSINLSAVLAFGGVGGLVVGFAAKDLLSNFFGGLMIYLDRPFSVGEHIRSPDREIEGTVEHIGWRLTKIRALDKTPIYVPNSIFSTIAIANPSRSIS